MSEARRADVDVLRDVREELRWDARVEGAAITATSFDGVVTLKGTVRSQAKGLPLRKLTGCQLVAWCSSSPQNRTNEYPQRKCFITAVARRAG